MKVELHLHTSRYSGCATAGAAELMPRLIAAGYGAVYITEHDAVWPAPEIAELQREFPRIRIFPGVEISLGAGGASLQHLLVLGVTDPGILVLRDAGAVLDAARAAGHLTVLAHPTRWDGAAAILDEGLLPDAIEYHSGNQDPYRAELAKKRAEALSLPLVNAGDVHGLEFLDRFWIETARAIEQPDDIRGIVLSGAYENRQARPA